MAIGVSNFPTALDDAISLIQSANLAATTLTAQYNPGASTLTVASNVLFPATGLLSIGTIGLILSYTGKSSTTGFTGVARVSTALEPNNPADAVVASGQAVEGRITSGSLQVLRQALIALETKLGIGVDTPTTGEFLQASAPGVSGWSVLTSGAVTTALGYTPQTPLGFTPPDFHGRIIIADDQAGANLGAKINAADALLGGSEGEIWVLSDALAISTAVSVSANHVLRFFPGTFVQSQTITLGGNGAVLRGSGTGATIFSNTSTTVNSVAIADGVLGFTVEHLKLFRNATPTSSAHGLVQLGTTDGSLISNVVLEGHYRGLVLGPCGYGRVQNVTTTKNLDHGIFMTNTPGWGALQWTVREVASTQNAGSGICVLGQNTGPANITMGAWSEILTFANTGNGARVTSVAAVPIYGVRMTECFWGEDGDSEVFLDTYGSFHKIIDNVIELSGSRTTGPTFGTAASNIGHGINITVNNQTVDIADTYIVDCSRNGIECQATSATISGCTVVDNGRAAGGGAVQIGIHVICTRACLVGNSVYNEDFTTQLFAIYSDNDTSVISGNTLQGTSQAIAFNTGPLVSQVQGNRISGTAGVESFRADNLTIADAKNVILGSTTGTKIGTATTQKLGFYNATPIVQRAAAAQAAAPAGGVGATAGAYDTAVNRDAMIALVNEMRTVLINLGLMKGSA